MTCQCGARREATATRMREESTIEAIVAAWRSLARVSADPTPRGGDRGERERALVRSLIAATEDLEDEEAVLRSVALTAVAYGDDSHRQRIDPAHLLRELVALRHATFDVFRVESPADASRRIIRFDRALSVAYRVTLRSSHRTGLQRPGAWDGRSDDAVRDIVRDTLGERHGRGSQSE